MTSNQMSNLRSQIERQRQSSRDALAYVLRQKRRYKSRPAFINLVSYYDGSETELKVSIRILESLLHTIGLMEEFNAYS